MIYSTDISCVSSIPHSSDYSNKGDFHCQKSKLTTLARWKRWKAEAKGFGLDGINTRLLLVFTNSGERVPEKLSCIK